jgi:hypothetical protein
MILRMCQNQCFIILKRINSKKKCLK